MPSTFYAGGVGCDCCDGGTPCATTCSPCSAVTASDYCFCVERLVFTKGAGGDLDSFDYTFDTPVCFVGSCVGGSTIIAFGPPLETVITASGRKIVVTISGSVTCETDMSGNYYQLNLGIVMEPQEFGYVSPSYNVAEVGIADTSLEADRCDIDAMIGTIEPEFINVSTADDLIVTCTFASGGC